MELSRKQDVIVAAVMAHEKSINEVDGQFESIEAVITKLEDGQTKIKKELEEEAELKEREEKLSKEV
jgi:hypothetical protein